jgi:hypothetical protein
VFDRVATITIPTGTEVEFPDQCVGCGQPAPGHTTLVVTRDARHTVAFWAGWHRVRIPACRRCARNLQFWRWWSLLRTLLVGAAGIAFGLLVLQRRLSGFVTGIIVLLLIGVAFMFLFFLDRRFPPSFNIDVRGALTDYEFRSAGYAKQFATRNGASPGATA